MLAPDAGEVSWRGHRLTRQDRAPLRLHAGGARPLPEDDAPASRSSYLGRLHGLDAAAARRATDALLERVGLGERGDDLLETLSLGNQQRAQIAAALVHDPEVLVLDEPFSGLDPLAVDTVVAVLRERAAAGAPVLFSSHQLDVVERLCDDLVIIADGGDPGRRQPRGAARRVHPAPLRAGGRRRRRLAARPARASPLSSSTARAPSSTSPAGADEQPVLRAALARGPVRAFGPVTPSLAEIFREVTQ